MSAWLQYAAHARPKEKVTVHDKDHAAAFKNHIITRMLHGSLNTMRAVDGHWLVEIISRFWNANCGIIHTVFILGHAHIYPIMQPK